MALDKIERELFRTCVDENDSLAVVVESRVGYHVYKSRFLSMTEGQAVIIDMPTPDSPDAPPISKSAELTIYFKIEKSSMHYFQTKILNNFLYDFNDRKIRAFEIQWPEVLHEGQRREYFRVRTPTNPPLRLKLQFKMLHQGLSKSDVGVPMEIDAIMYDISGGGMGIKVIDKDEQQYDFKKGDVMQIVFKLQSDWDPISLWCEIRNKRKQAESAFFILGVQFMPEEKNKLLKIERNKIIKYVVMRQRELMVNQ